MKHSFRYATALLAVALSACESPHLPHSAVLSSVLGKARAVMLPEPLPAATVDVLVDGSGGSPDPTLVRPSIEAVATFLADRPKSVIRFWVLGDTASTTRIVAQHVVGAPRSKAREAINKHREREVASILERYDDVEVPVARQSPLFASVTRIAQENTIGERIIVIASDLLSNDENGDLECHDADEARFTQGLQRRRLFLPESLHNIRLIGVQTGLRPIHNNRCSATIAHRDNVIQLWTTVTGAAGGTFTALSANITNELGANE